jgi:hypothetical protein
VSGSELKLIHAARFRDFHLKNGNDLGFKKILYTDYTVIGNTWSLDLWIQNPTVGFCWSSVVGEKTTTCGS